MFDHSLLAEKLVQIRREELLRAAEMERLAKAAYAGSGKRPLQRAERPVEWALGWLGRRLVDWGQHLQGREAVSDPPVYRPE
jgi:hypothetical protein